MNKKTLYTFCASLGINIILLSTVLVLVLQSKTIVTDQQKLNQYIQIQDGPMQKPVQKIYELNVSSTPLTVEKNEYLDQSLNSSMKYPSTLTQPSVSIVATKENRPDVGSVTLYDKISKEWWDACENCFEGGPDHIQITIYKNPKKLLPKDWIIENKNAPHIYSNYDYLSHDIEEDIDVSGKNAIKYSWFGLGGADVVVFSDDENGLIYMISAIYMSKNSTIRGDLWYVISSFSLLKNK